MLGEAPAPRFRSLWSTIPGSRRVLALRLGLATAGSLASAVVMRSWPPWAHESLPLGLWIPAVLLVAAGLLAHHAAAGSQLLARSVWWAHLVLGTVLSFFGDEGVPLRGLILAISAGAALLAMGRLGLDEAERSVFRPVAFRTTLTLSMVMAVADLQALALFGSIKLQEGLEATSKRAGALQHATLLLISAALISLAIAGLYRLQVWGLLLSAIGAGVVAVLSATKAYGIVGPIAVALTLTSIAQLLLPIPIVLAILRRRAPEPHPRLEQVGRLGLVVVVLAMMVASAVTVALGPSLSFD